MELPAGWRIATGGWQGAFLPMAKTNRDQVTNGTRVLPGVDGRSLVGRRYGHIASQMVADAGGLEGLAEGRLQLCRRFAGVSVLAEQMEARLALGEQIDTVEYGLLISSAVRIAGRIGVDRVPKDVTDDGPAFAVSSTVRYGHYEGDVLVIDGEDEPDGA